MSLLHFSFSWIVLVTITSTSTIVIIMLINTIIAIIIIVIMGSMYDIRRYINLLLLHKIEVILPTKSYLYAVGTFYVSLMIKYSSRILLSMLWMKHMELLEEPGNCGILF